MNANLPLVTIMIPTYGQAGIVTAAIDSALAQDYPALEVVVVDDASPDGTPEVVSRYVGDPRVRAVRHDRNKGRVATYRCTLRNHARGEFVLNLDGDDWLCDPTYISAAVNLLRLHGDIAVVFARMKVHDELTGEMEEQPAVWNIPTPCDGNEVFLLYATGAVIHHPTALYRRDAALLAGFYEHDVIGSDSVSFLRLLPGRRAAFLDRFVAVWRRHGNNASILTSSTDLIANFAVADVPAASREACEEIGSVALRKWRRAMSAQLGYRALSDKLAAGHAGAAVRVGFFMLRTRPSALTRSLGLVASGAVRYFRRDHRNILVSRHSPK